MPHAITTTSSSTCTTPSVAALAVNPSQLGAGMLSVMSLIRASRSRQTSSPA